MKIEKLNFDGFVCGIDVRIKCIIPIFYDCDRVDSEYACELFSENKNNIMKFEFEYESMDNVFCD